MSKFGFIGMGNMGYAILKGMLSKYPKEDFLFTERSDDRISFIKSEFDIEFTEDLKVLCSKTKYIILAIKPQNYPQVLTDIRNFISKDSIIITIAPGISIDTIKNYLGSDTKTVRTMPNTPALVSKGMTVISFSKDSFDDSEKDDTINIFSSCGEVEIVPEYYMNAAVPISGSSPAYIYILIEAMADAGVSMGLPRELSYKLASQSVLGSAEMVLQTKEHPAVLKDSVCSPAGTTIEAVATLEKEGFRSSIIEAMKAAYKKALSME